MSDSGDGEPASPEAAVTSGGLFAGVSAGLFGAGSMFNGSTALADTLSGALSKAAADASEALGTGVEKVAEVKAAAAAQIGRVAATTAQVDAVIQLEKTVEEFLTLTGESAPPGAGTAALIPLLRKRGLQLVNAAESASQAHVRYREQAEKAMERGKEYRAAAKAAEAALQQREQRIAALESALAALPASVGDAARVETALPQVVEPAEPAATEARTGGAAASSAWQLTIEPTGTSAVLVAFRKR